MNMYRRPSYVLQTRKELKESMKIKNNSLTVEILQRINNSRDTVDPNCSFTDILKDALIWASQDGFLDGVAMILDYGIDPKHTDVYGNSSLILAAERGHADIVRLLLRQKCDVNRADMETRTALHWSAMNGHLEIVHLLLSNGAVPDKKDKLYGYTPLMLAARQGHKEILKCLLEHHCDPNQMDIHQETAIFDAVRNGQIDCAKILLKAGAKIDLVDTHGRTLMLTAVLWNGVSVVALLVKLNTKINIPGVTQYVQSSYFRSGGFNQKLFTPIEAAMIEGKKDICNILYIAGAKTDILYKYAYDAVFRDYIKSITGIIENGEMMPWLEKTLNNPRSLKECSRIVIRECCESTNEFEQLSLPKSLVDFMNIPEIDEYL